MGTMTPEQAKAIRRVHPLADAFPLIDGPLFDELVASIRANGLRHPIVLLNGEILDGRNRYLACEAAGVEPRFEDFTGNDPLAFVIDENLTRRHLNESQRAMVAAKLANMPRGGDRTDQTANVQFAEQIRLAGRFGISRGNVSKIINERSY